MPNEHAPLVLRDESLTGWHENGINMASVPVQYGYGCLDGMVNTLKAEGDNLFLVAVDAGAHFARHLYNSARAVLYKTPGEVGSLEDAVKAGRSYDFAYPLTLDTRTGKLDLRSYYLLYSRLMLENIESGFVHGNYVRPFYSACEEMLDGTMSDFQINGRIYKKTFTIMMQYWPKILVPRHPDFPGLNLLVCQNSTCPAPGTSLIEFKSSSTYAPSRGPAVEEKNIFNERFGAKLAAHDILLYDHTSRFFKEASGSNLFFIGPKGDVFTPPLDRSVFPGLTRDFIEGLINSECGRALGLNLFEREIDPSLLPYFSREGGEVFLSGSALGVIPVKRIIMPKSKNPQEIEDYEVYEFRTGPDTRTAAISDCYKCFSVGDAFEVRSKSGIVTVRDYESCPLFFEIPKELREKAREKFMRAEGTRPLDVPSDQMLSSGKVAALAPKRSLVHTMSALKF